VPLAYHLDIFFYRCIWYLLKHLPGFKNCWRKGN